MSDEFIVLNNIYSLLQQWQPFVNLLTGILQFGIVVVVCFALYKLFNLFF